MTTETTVKNCTTCAHFRLAAHPDRVNQERFGHCLRFGMFGSVAMQYRCELKAWHPITPVPEKPRLSLFAWLRDTIWRT